MAIDDDQDNFGFGSFRQATTPLETEADANNYANGIIQQRRNQLQQQAAGIPSVGGSSSIAGGSGSVTAPAAGGDATKIQLDTIDKLIAQGYTPAQAAGRVGAWSGESGQRLDPGSFNPHDPNGGSRGVVNWLNEKGEGRGRLADGQAWAARNGLNWNDRDTQIAWAHQEDLTTERRGYDATRAAKTPSEAAAATTLYNIRPKKETANLAQRQATAERIYQIWLQHHQNAGTFNGQPTPGS